MSGCTSKNVNIARKTTDEKALIEGELAEPPTAISSHINIMFEAISLVQKQLAAISACYATIEERERELRAQVKAAQDELVQVKADKKRLENQLEDAVMKLEKLSHEDMKERSMPPCILEVLDFMDSRSEDWKGSANQLVDDAGITDIAAQALTRHLNRYKKYLLSRGVRYGYRRTASARIITLAKVECEMPHENKRREGAPVRV